MEFKTQVFLAEHFGHHFLFLMLARSLKGLSVHRQLSRGAIPRRFQSTKGSSAYGYAESRSESTPAEDLAVYKQSQRLRGMVMGAVALATLIGGFQVYSNRNWIRAQIWGDNFDGESFDEMYAGLVEKKQKRNQSLLASAQTVTNPNGTEVPGVYVCGNNKYGLVEPTGEFDVVPLFKRLDVFDNFVVRDIVMGEKSGALVNDKGDLYQWGKGFGGDSKQPTLKGKGLVKVQISNGVVYALNGKGEVFGLAEDAAEQKLPLGKAKGWLGSYTVPYFKLNASKIVDMCSGAEHLILLDSEGQVSTCATGLPGTVLAQSHGQFGLPEYSQFDEPPAPNMVYPVVLLNRYKEGDSIKMRDIVSIASGNYTSLARDSSGALWGWGWNKYGTVGKPVSFETEFISYPVQVGFGPRFKRSESAKAVDLVAGGDTAFAGVEVSDMYAGWNSQGGVLGAKKEPAKASQDSSLRYFAWGHGLKGSLGVSPQTFVHFAATPREMKALELEEYNETTAQLEPIGVRQWAIGNRHGGAVLNNGDVMMWGDGTSGQLGDGKRTRRGAPGYIPKIMEPNHTRTAGINDRLQLETRGPYMPRLYAGYDTSAVVYTRTH